MTGKMESVGAAKAGYDIKLQRGRSQPFNLLLPYNQVNKLVV